jgi:uncharacterized protein (TIGR02246 family)
MTSRQDDEQAIRQLVEKWMAASKKGDLKTVLSLMSDDAIFMVPGREPFGKEEFISNSESMKGVRIEGESNIQEIKVLGDWAWMRNYLKVKITTLGGATSVHSGYVLTILQKQPAGNWVITRDANLLTPTS